MDENAGSTQVMSNFNTAVRILRGLLIALS